MRKVTPADEAAIERAYHARHAQMQADADAAQPKCCALWHRKHTRACQNRSHDAEQADGLRWLGRLVRRVLRYLARNGGVP